jgi:transcriptional regulator with XRE-family HTH domain
MSDIGTRVKEERKKRELPLRELARLSGLSAPYLLDIERGRRQPSDKSLGRLAKALGISKKSLSDARVERESGNSQSTLSLHSKESSFLKDEELIIRLAASGIMDLFQNITRSNQPLSIPYPSRLQQSLDRLLLLCLIHRQAPPLHIPDLLTLCEEPFAKWPLPQLPPDVHPEDSLLCNQLPTYFCEEYACSESDPAANLFEVRFIEQLRAACADNPRLYTLARELLITRLVLTEQEFTGIIHKPPFNLIRDILKEAYEVAPLFFCHQGHFRCCPQCGSLLIRSAKNLWVCQEESCDFSPTSDDRALRKMHISESVYFLKRPLRRYIAFPGKSEVQLRDQLEKIKAKKPIKVELWPLLDVYDLRLTFPDGEVWAIDVKDWANPYRLAHAVRPFRTDPPWNRALFVFPDHHRKRRPNYLNAFRSQCVLLDDEKVSAMFETDLVAAARRKLKDN